MDVAHNIETQFQEAMINAGVVINDTPIADSQLHRFDVEGDKRGSNNGWYVLHGDSNPKGCFGSWKLDIDDTWSLKDVQTYTPQERAEWVKQMAEVKAKREAEKEKRHADAKEKAKDLWRVAIVDPIEHPYIKTKQVIPFGIKQHDETLIIPLRDSEGVIHSLQFIDKEGNKRFLTGGKVAGCYYAIGEIKNRLFICEGYATGATIHEATEHAVAIAFNTTNLKPVAEALRRQYPELEIVICADNDQWTEGNPGVTKATKAAKAVNGKLVIPEFSNTKSKPTDFNDMATLDGLEQVKKCIDEAQACGETQESLIINQAMIEKVQELARLPDLEYEQVRKKEAKELNIRESALDKAISKERKQLEQIELADNSIVSEVEEWPEAIRGDQLFSELKAIYKQYALLPAGADVALSLWTLGTFCFDAFRIFPMIGLTSPEKRYGKSTVLSLLQALTNKALPSSNISFAVIYRVIELCKPTLLIDEGDTFLKNNNELRGVINSGHARDMAYVVRCDGEQNEPRKFSTWCPKALAMIGDLPDTIKDRSLVITMRRRLPDETVTKMPLNAAEQFEDIRRKCKRWAIDHFEQLTQHIPALPHHNNDREIDNWTPLFSIAEVCGLGQEVLNAMVSISPTGEEDSIGPILLNDIKAVFENRETDKISSQDLVDDLIELDDRPWAEWKRGRPITKNSLARLLKPYKIKSKTVRFGLDTSKGYSFDSFQDVFNRYLTPDTPFQNVTPSQVNSSNTFSDNSKRHTKEDVTFQNTLKVNANNDCDGVTFENTDKGGNACIPHAQVTI